MYALQGHTKLLLFFQVGIGFSLVDMPGYGFNQPQNFIISAEGFLKERKKYDLDYSFHCEVRLYQSWPGI